MVIAVLALIDTYSNLVAIHLVKLKALEYAGGQVQSALKSVQITERHF